MPSRNTLNLQTVKELVGTGLLVAAIPALVSATAQWVFYRFELGMHHTAFYYFRAAINDYRVAVTLAAVLFVSFFAYWILASVLNDRVKAARYTYRAILLLLFGLLLMTGYRLNRVDWYPAPFSRAGVCHNAGLILPFAIVGFLIYRQRAEVNSRLGLLLAASLVLAPNGYFYYLRSTGPALFVDVAGGVGLKEMDNSLGVAWGDYDNDGWPDVYISNHLPASVHSLLYHNDHGTFSEPRLMATGDMHGAAWGDFDNDGALDLFAAGGNDTPKGPPYPNVLFHNKGGDFKNVAVSAGVDEPLGRAWGANWADIDNDGFLDLFVVNYFSSNDLFLNAGNGTFKNIAQAAGLSKTPPGEVNEVGTLCASWGDYDGDGDMDLVTTAMQTGIALYRNNGNETFSDVANDAGVVTSNYLGTEKDPRGLSGCAWGDYDNDGDLDLYIGALSGRSGKNLLFRNQGNGTFVEVAAAAHVDAAASTRAVMWGDFDNDGDLDLYVVNEVSEVKGEDKRGWNSLYLNQGDGTFVAADADTSGVAGFPFVYEGTGALVDYDNDGFLDIFINNQRPSEGRPFYLRRNILLRNAGNSNGWLKIRLRGTVSNRDGNGAKISLSVGRLQQFRESGGESHIFAQNSSVIHFGLGKATVVDRILVKWPSGITQTLTNVPANRMLTITEELRLLE